MACGPSGVCGPNAHSPAATALKHALAHVVGRSMAVGIVVALTWTQDTVTHNLVQVSRAKIIVVHHRLVVRFAACFVFHTRVRLFLNVLCFFLFFTGRARKYLPCVSLKWYIFYQSRVVLKKKQIFECYKILVLCTNVFFSGWSLGRVDVMVCL